MKQLNINLIVLALSIAFSTGATAQNAIPAVGAQPIESIESVESAESAALLAAARKKALSVRLDALYEVAKEQCNTYAVDARPHCLIQMKAGFGK